MQDDQSKETLSIREVRFWSEGKITESAYNQIKKHQANKEKVYAQAMLDEWIV